MTRRIIGAALAAALIAVAIHGSATAETSPGAEPDPHAPIDPHGFQTPRSTMLGFLIASRARDYERAASHLDLALISPDRREQRAPQLARHLQVVLDRELWVDVDSLSNQVDGDTEDGLAPDLDRIGFIETARGPADLLLQRVRGPSGGPIWLISAATVARIPALYDEFGYGPLGELLPSRLFEIRILEAELWQWLAMLVLAFVVYLLGWLAASALLRIARPFVIRSDTDLDDQLLRALIGPLRLLIFVGLFTIGSAPLALSVPVERVISGLEKAGAIVALTWFLIRIVDLMANITAQRLVARGQAPAIGFVPIGRRTLRIVLLAVATLAVLDSIGFDVTALVAGLGLGGLAIALAAQKTLENVFGGFMLLADRPVAVGDFCRFGDRVGTVEEIGMRSTRVRTLDRTIVTIPNAQFSTFQLENFAKRDNVRLHTVLGLRYETTPDQLRFVLAGLRSLLLEHSRVSADPARVRFVGFGAHSLDLEVFAYVTTGDWNEFLAIREDIYLRMMQVVEEAGSGFAFPSQTLYVGKDEGIEREKAAAAEAQVAAWRAANDLPFPEFSREKQERSRDTLDYPPEGSPNRRARISVDARRGDESGGVDS